jgi:hypothetical protein
MRLRQAATVTRALAYRGHLDLLEPGLQFSHRQLERAGRRFVADLQPPFVDIDFRDLAGSLTIAGRVTRTSFTENNPRAADQTAPSLSSAISCSRPRSSATISASACSQWFDRSAFWAARVLPDFVGPLADPLFVPPAVHFPIYLSGLVGWFRDAFCGIPVHGQLTIGIPSALAVPVLLHGSSRRVRAGLDR